MVYKAVFLLLALAVSKTVVAQQCSTKQSDGSGVPDQGRNAPDLQQVVTTKYCFLNDCTIMDYETGQHLNIIYTTDSLLVVTPKGNHTSMAVAKQEDHYGFKCASINFVSQMLILTMLLTTFVVMSFYICNMHRVLHCFWCPVCTLQWYRCVTGFFALYTNLMVLQSRFTTGILCCAVCSHAGLDVH